MSQLGFLATPTNFITQDDPPFLFFHGTDDWVVPETSARKMHQALTSRGMESIFQPYDGYGHFALFSHIEAMDPVAVACALRDHARCVGIDPVAAVALGDAGRDDTGTTDPEARTLVVDGGTAGIRDPVR